MVNLAFNTTEPSIGLGLKQRDNSLKCYMNDTGLMKCIKKYSSHLTQAYIVHTGDLNRDGDYLYIPLYMVPCL